MWVGPETQLAVSWEGHFDASSGIVRYTAAIEAPGEPINHTAFPPTDAGLASVAWVDVPGLAHNKYYYSTVRVRDAVGFETLCQSDGFRTDFTPPVAGNIDIKLGLRHLVWLSWGNFSDHESGIQQYLVALGTDANSTAFRGFQTAGTGREAVMTALRLPEGHVRVTVRAQNRAGAYTDVNTTTVIRSWY